MLEKDTFAVRSIDVTRPASIDLVALNNEIVKMRPVVKKTRVQLINKLTRQIAGLKKKKGDEKQVEKNKRKAERMISEIGIMKNLKVDRISKFGLANTESFCDICKHPSVSIETRTLVRLAEHKLMKSLVGKFRSRHEDWKALSSFLLMKNTGRRFKKNKDICVKKVRTNIKAGETLMKSYLENKLGSDALRNFSKVVKETQDIEARDQCHDVSSRGKSEIGDISGEKETQDIEARDQCHDVSSHGKSEIGDISGEKETQDIEARDQCHDVSSLGKSEIGEISAKKETQDIEARDQCDDVSSDDKSESGEISSDEKEQYRNTDEVDMEQQSVSPKKVLKQTDMVVRKINISKLADDFQTSQNSLRDADNIPLILTIVDSKNVTTTEEKIQRPKKKNPFFMTSDNENDSEDEGNEQNCNSGKERSRDIEDQIVPKPKMESSFINSLADTKERKRIQKRAHFINQQRFTEPNKFSKQRSQGRSDHEPHSKSFKQNDRSKSTASVWQHKKDHNNDSKSSFPAQRDKPSQNVNEPKEKLHPSWEASKKRKEQMCMIQPFQGKKIKFDD